MKIEFDSERNTRNIELRGISFEETARFEWDSALIILDTRRNYNEPRYRAFGFIENRLHALVFTPREGAIRVISLRKANRREVHRWSLRGFRAGTAILHGLDPSRPVSRIPLALDAGVI